MEDFLTRLRNWNTRLNDIPRRLLLIGIVVASCFLAVKLLPLCWPFVLALLFAMIMEPLVRLLRRAFGKLSIGKNLATILSMIVLFGLLGWGLRALVTRLIQEVKSLAAAAPYLWQTLSSQVTSWAADLTTRYKDVLPENLTSLINSTLREAGSELTDVARTISRTVASGAWATAMSVPTLLLSTVLTIMGTYYLSSDRERIFAFFKRTFPAGMVRKGILLKRNMFKALFGQLRAQLLVSMLVTLVIILGLVIQNTRYALLLGLLIGVIDALPVLGAGLFLIPWSLVGFVTGDTATGVGMALLYLSIIVVRQIAEPRIVGRSLGLYPLATMMVMYAGLQITGNVLGLLLAPVLLNLCKVVLQADSGAELPPLPPRMKITFKRRQPDASSTPPEKQE